MLITLIIYGGSRNFPKGDRARRYGDEPLQKLWVNSPEPKKLKQNVKLTYNSNDLLFNAALTGER